MALPSSALLVKWFIAETASCTYFSWGNQSIGTRLHRACPRTGTVVEVEGRGVRPLHQALSSTGEPPRAVLSSLGLSFCVVAKSRLSCLLRITFQPSNPSWTVNSRKPSAHLRLELHSNSSSRSPRCMPTFFLSSLLYVLPPSRDEASSTTCSGI